MNATSGTKTVSPVTNTNTVVQQATEQAEQFEAVLDARAELVALVDCHVHPLIRPYEQLTRRLSAQAGGLAIAAVAKELSSRAELPAFTRTAVYETVQFRSVLQAAADRLVS